MDFISISSISPFILSHLSLTHSQELYILLLLLTSWYDEIFPNIPINFSALENMTLLKLRKFIRLWIESAFSQNTTTAQISRPLSIFTLSLIGEHSLKEVLHVYSLQLLRVTILILQFVLLHFLLFLIYNTMLAISHINMSFRAVLMVISD